jgi:hypothetical protein
VARSLPPNPEPVLNEDRLMGFSGIMALAGARNGLQTAANDGPRKERDEREADDHHEDAGQVHFGRF